jgi:hypothetical protein
LEARATAPQKKRWERRKSADFKRFSASREREGRGNFLRGLVVGGVAAVRAAGAAFLGAGAKRFVDDGLDRARAPAAFGAAAEATVNLFGIPRQVRGCTYGIPDIVVTQNVAGTDDHETAKTLVMRSHRYFRVRRDAKGKAAFSSNSKLMPGKYWNESKQAPLS